MPLVSKQVFNRLRAIAAIVTVASLFTLFSAKPNLAAEENAVKPQASNSEAGLKPVLDPKKFFGHARSGYEAARLCPEICAKLFCYCGCDMTDEHDSLLDCFTSDHGVDCRICQEEALIALKMKREGKSMKQIQQSIDTIFEKEYPFDEPTATIKKYRATRLWQPSQTLLKSGENKSTGPKATIARGKKTSARSSCCGGTKHR